MRLPGRQWWMIGWLAGLVLGCGGDKIATVPVSGVITLDGQPLAEASVTFQPLSGDAAAPGSHGNTDAQGRFTLRVTVTNQPGAVVGKHQVRISAAPRTGGDDSQLVAADPVPPRYRDGSETCDVPPKGTDQANFDMKSK